MIGPMPERPIGESLLRSLGKALKSCADREQEIVGYDPQPVHAVHEITGCEETRKSGYARRRATKLAKATLAGYLVYETTL